MTAPRLGALALAAALLLPACTDRDEPPFVPPDAPPQLDGGGGFLVPCQKDGDCLSGQCALLGGTMRCTRPCSTSAPCPALSGWSCGAQSVCECSGAGKEPNLCNVDGDCDGEADRAITPESCNSEDDDCNGEVDDVPAETEGSKKYHRDEDGDGWGDLSHFDWLCAPAAGWVVKQGDCDDDREDVSPDLTEVCGDGVDNDCDSLEEDADICGLTPPLVQDVDDDQALSGTLKQCGTSATLDESLDIKEVVAKQDKLSIKYTVRLAGAPALSSCTSYILRLGTFDKAYEMAYVYRPAGALVCGSLPESAVYQKGQVATTTAKLGFNAGDPGQGGHVSFTIPKSEYFSSLSTPSYYLKVCVNATADATKDITDCVDDSCEMPVHR